MRIAVIVILVISALGCAAPPEVSEPVARYDAPPAAQELGEIELHTFYLAEELFESLHARFEHLNRGRFAVATFVPITTMQYQPEQQHPLNLLGHQLEQGLMTEASRRGYITHDFKVSNNLIMESQADRVLSRNVSNLAERHPVDFYITGTLTEQENGATVNARIISADDRSVLAAATKFFPLELFWQNERVTTRNGMLYIKRASE